MIIVLSCTAAQLCHWAVHSVFSAYAMSGCTASCSQCKTDAGGLPQEGAASVFCASSQGTCRGNMTALMCVTAGLVRASCPQRIAKVHDQYLSFMALEARLFSLGLPDTYLQLNDPKAQDTQIQVCPHPHCLVYILGCCSHRGLLPGKHCAQASRCLLEESAQER